MNSKKYENIIKMNNSERYDYLIRKVADFQNIYLIYGKFSEMIMQSVNRIECAVVFPEQEFSEIYNKQKKIEGKIQKIDVYDFINWLEKDNSKKMRIAVFPNEQNDAKIVYSPELRNDLIEECKEYE